MNIDEKVTSVADILENSDLSFGQGADAAMDEATWIVLTALEIDIRKVIDGEVDVWLEEIDDAQLEMVDSWVHKRISFQKPFAYLVKEAWFCGNPFYVDERVIIPRSYFSEWIPDRFEPWIDSDKVRNVLDLCTGSGCIAISCALAFPEADVTASDIDEKALQVAAKNIERYDLSERVTLCQSDTFQNIDSRYDLIVCNPPYVSNARMALLPKEFLQEPDHALRAGDDGLDFILPMLSQAMEHLTEDGTLLVEAGSASNALEHRFPGFPFEWISTEFDEMVIFIMTFKQLKQFLLIADSNDVL
jgi:ribosomal protein L3 glutamine methyltransferase